MNNKIELTVGSTHSLIKAIEKMEAAREIQEAVSLKMRVPRELLEPKIERPRRDEVKDHEYIVQTRRCLGCDNKFRSSCWGHRMCKNCR